MIDETIRAAELWEAQAKAGQLFREIEARGLIRPGISEGALNAEIYALAQEMFGISTYWHKRIVRAGRNTLLPYDENPPDLVLGEDDILFLDLGPVFEEWEADFGRTFVLGSDPAKLKLRGGRNISRSIRRLQAGSFMRMRRSWRSNLAGSLAGRLRGT